MLKIWDFASMLGLANMSEAWDPCEPAVRPTRVSAHVFSAISNALTKKRTRLKEIDCKFFKFNLIKKTFLGGGDYKLNGFNCKKVP